MNQSPVSRAVRNNALWCDTVCSSRGNPGLFETHLWSNQEAPPFYPDAITLTREDSTKQQMSIGEMVERDAYRSWSVKDSYGILPLHELGFDVLLEAEWIAFSARDTATHRSSRSLTWRRMKTAADLSEWKSAWAVNDSLSVADEIFDETLLSNPDIALLLAFSDDDPIGGAALNRGAGVVGLSNVFAAVEIGAVWNGLVSEAAEIFPGMSLVGYERDEDLAPAMAVGFEAVGPLRVWLREERPKSE